MIIDGNDPGTAGNSLGQMNGPVIEDDDRSHGELHENEIDGFCHDRSGDDDYLNCFHHTHYLVRPPTILIATVAVGSTAMTICASTTASSTKLQLGKPYFPTLTVVHIKNWMKEKDGES